MRILLIGNFAPDRQESMLRFARAMHAGLRSAGHTVDLWSPTPVIAGFLNSYRYDGLAKYLGYLDKFLLFPQQIRRRLARLRARGEQPELVHIVDHGNVVYAPLFDGIPLVVTCHDLLQIRSAVGEIAIHPVSRMGRLYQRWILHHLRRVDHIVCNSTETSRDVLRVAGQARDHLTVVPLGLNYPYAPLPRAHAEAVVQRLLAARGRTAGDIGLGGPGFLLNLGGSQWYKNRRGLLEIFAGLRTRLAPCPRLVMVSKPLAPELLAHARSLGITDVLTELGSVSEEELQALYSLAEGFLFPSWHEGFGWPVAEAQACGCPVFTSNRAPLPEVGGEAAIYIDPADPAGAAAQIAACWPERAELRRRGLARAPFWAQERMIADYTHCYLEARATRPQRATVRAPAMALW